MNFRFTNAGKGNLEILRLEKEIAKVDPTFEPRTGNFTIYKMVKLNEEIVRLEKVLAAKQKLRLADPSRQVEKQRTIAAATAILAMPLFTCRLHPQVESGDQDEPCPLCGAKLHPLAVSISTATTGLTGRARAVAGIIREIANEKGVHRFPRSK